MEIVNAWGPMLATLAVLLALFTFMWRAMGERLDGFGRRFDDLEHRFDTKIDGLEQRLDAKIDGVEQRLDAKIDALADVTDRRLTSLETDMTIIKQHLLNASAA